MQCELPDFLGATLAPPDLEAYMQNRMLSVEKAKPGLRLGSNPICLSDQIGNSFDTSQFSEQFRNLPDLI